jgi:hypothetical protein
MNQDDGGIIQELSKRLAAPKVLTVDGVERAYIPLADGSWALAPLGGEPWRTRRSEPLELSTLEGLMVYARRQPECTLVVVNEQEVTLYEEYSQADARHVLRAKAVVRGVFEDDQWRLGRWYALEDVVIALQTRFQPTAIRSGVLDLLSRVRNEAVRIDENDGATQVVTVRKGVTVNMTVPVPNPVILQGYRTFHEVDPQPEGAYVLRVRNRATDGSVEAALFEADGGAWKVRAIEGIKAWFGAQDVQQHLVLV